MDHASLKLSEFEFAFGALEIFEKVFSNDEVGDSFYLSQTAIED